MAFSKFHFTKVQWDFIRAISMYRSPSQRFGFGKMGGGEE